MGSSLFVFIFIACFLFTAYRIITHVQTDTVLPGSQTQTLLQFDLPDLCPNQSTSDLFLEPKNGGERIVTSRKNTN